jgi:lipoate-protein ligase A
MRVLRGRAATIEADHDRTDAMVERVVETGEPALRVWTPHRQIAFGRRDANAAGYDRARQIARDRDYTPVERRVGGRAVAFTGTTLAAVYADPDVDRTAIHSRYETAIERYRRALDSLGVDAREGEPPEAFCPGTHSLRASGKLAGLAQRVRRDVALTAAVVVVADDAELAEALPPVYDALGIPFDPTTVDSVAAAGGPADPDAVAAAIVDAHDATAERD